MRFKTEFAAAKHGTELGLYRNASVDTRQRYNGKCFFPDAGRNVFPVGLGNMAVGRVTEVGSSVNRFELFDHVILSYELP